MYKNLFLLNILLVLLLPFSAYSAERTGPAIGKKSPNIVGRTPDGHWYRLEKDKGVAKVVNFFWVKCEPCRKEMPELAKLEKQFSEIKFISVHTQSETSGNVTNFLQSLESYPSNIVLTTGGIQESFNYLGLPHTIILDKDNVVLMNMVGYTPENMQKIKELLQQMTM